MPTSFLTREQREAFGRFSGPPSSEDMDRYFHLDGDELATVGQMRGAVNRLGFATLVCSVKFIGTFPTRRIDDIPDTVITFLSDQLGGSEPGAFGGYFDSSSPTYKRHTALIRAQFGYRDFHNAPDAILGVSRRLYAFCWAGDDKPVALVQWASHWLVNSKVILPGVSTLERLVGRVRDRARLRLWHRLANGLNDSQRTQMEALFDQGRRTSGWIGSSARQSIEAPAKPIFCVIWTGWMHCVTSDCALRHRKMCQRHNWNGWRKLHGVRNLRRSRR